jgi:hypothetical protein
MSNEKASVDNGARRAAVGALNEVRVCEQANNCTRMSGGQKSASNNAEMQQQ